MPFLTTRGGGSIRGYGTFGVAPEPPPTVIGQSYGGGFYAGQISITANGVPTHYLVVAPKSLGENSSLAWKTANTATTGTGSIFDGPSNSSNMNNANHPAAQFCEGLIISGYGDWYLPARDELEICYFNLKPSTDLNTTASGANGYSVPIRSTDYTTTVPAQTASVDFQAGGSEAFENQNYWASTAFSATNGWILDFQTGVQSNTQKISTLYVRAIRRVPV